METHLLMCTTAPTSPAWSLFGRSVGSMWRNLKLVADLTHQLKPPKAGEPGTAPRLVPLRLGHLLSNVGAIPDSAQHVSDPYDRQLLLENAGYDAAQAEWYDLSKAQVDQGIPNDTSLSSRPLQQWMWKWHKALTKKFEEIGEHSDFDSTVDSSSRGVSIPARCLRDL